MRDLIVSARRVSLRSQRRRRHLAAVAACPFVAGLLVASPSAYGQRVFGLDTSSAANTNAPSQTAWNNAFNDADGNGVAYSFAFVRSSRGGTSDATRLDDGHFYDNITRATAAGMLAGSYHYSRPDVTTHTAADDASHYLERAGMYMKPGFLLPVFDLEAGNSQNTTAQLTAWGTEWMNTIKNAIGVYPIVYTNSSYNNDEVTAALAFGNTGTTPKTNPITYQWLARPSGNLQTGQPGAAGNYPNPYGVWDPNFISRTNSRDPAVNPWAFWQNGAGSPNGFLIDYNAANGNIEFVRDFLVPALWTNSGSGDWGTIANWNSNNPGYVAGNTATGPAPRLPKYDATNVTKSLRAYDWVKLQNPGNGTVTISSGAQGVRKFYTQQPLNITGGSLSVNYLPGSGGKWDVPSEFAAAVTMGSGTAYTSYSTDVDGGGGVFNVNGGTVTFNSINLAVHDSAPGRVVIGGNPTLSPYGNAGTAVIRPVGTFTPIVQAATVELTAGDRTLTVTNGSAAVDVRIDARVIGAGRLVKSGAGTLELSRIANTYSGGTSVNAGRLRITADNNLGTVPAAAQPNNLVLNGGTLQTGAAVNTVSLTNAGANYTSFPTVNIGGAGPDALAPAVNVLAGVRTIAVTNGGSGYVNQSSAPAANSAGTFVDIVGGGGTGATAFATVVGGVVTSITITNQGTGYTSVPTIHISSTGLDTDPDPGVTTLFAGSGAVASVNGITLQSLALTDAGFDYANPTISLNGGGGSGATASITATAPLTLAANRGIQLGATGGTVYPASGSTLVAAGVVSGSGPFTKEGTGTLVLSGVNTYTGATTINAGTLTATGTSGLGATTGALAINNPNTGAGNAVVLNLSTTAATTKGSLSGLISPPGSGTNTVTINNGGQLFTINQTAPGTFPGVIAGGGGFALGALSTNTLTLSGVNTYTGGTTVNAGTLAYGASNVLADSGAVNVAGGTLSLGAFNDTVGAVALAGGTITGTTGTLTGASYAVQSGSISAKLAGAAAMTKTTVGTVTLSGVNSYSGGTAVNGGALIAGHHAAFGTDGLTVAAGATARAQAGLTNAMSLSTVGTTGTGQFDLTNNSLVVKNSSLAVVQAQVAKAFNQGTWAGTGGINSSTAASDPTHLTAVGVASNGVLNKTVFKGVTGLDADDVLVKYTYYGDADLTGVVTLDDFTLFLNGYRNAGTNWAQGDFDYSGHVTLDDFSMFLAGYQYQGAALSEVGEAIETSGASPEQVAAMMAALQAVPEPASAAVLAAGGLLGFATRRRRPRSR